MSGKPNNWPVAVLLGVGRALGALICLCGLHRWEKHGLMGWRCSGCHRWDDD